MTIVHLIPQLRFGAGRAVVDLCLAQRRLGHVVRVAVSEDVDSTWRSDGTLLAELRAASIPWVTAGDFFRRDAAGLVGAAACLAAWLGPSAGAMVHAHTAMAAACARMAGVDAVVCTCHGWNPERDRAVLLQDTIALHACAVVTSPSAAWAARLERETGLRGVEVVRCGLDLRRYPAPRERAPRRAGGFRIAYAAEISRRKGLDVLLAALPAVARQVPAAELHVFGDGPQAQDARAHAASLGSGCRVVFHGQVHDIYERLQAFDVFCLPSRSDNLPIAIIEALLAGVPVVAARVGGIPELVEPARAGLLVPPEAPSALAAALVDLAGSADRGDMGRRGATFARHHFEADRVAQVFDRLYARAAHGIRVPRC